MVPGYPRDLYAKDSSFITVKDQYEEEEYTKRGWTTYQPRPAEPESAPEPEAASEETVEDAPSPGKKDKPKK